MALRRPHRKSRHGCVECKRRRVKCDESRPSCSNCSKRKARCEYDSSGSLLWADGKAQSHASRSNKSASEGPQEQESFHDMANSFGVLGMLGGHSATSPYSLASLNLCDLELMMQWCNATYLVFSRNDQTDPIWRARVPEEALLHSFLMHGILAMSALHISRTRNDHRRADYISIAVAHQDQALALFRERLHDINPTNAKAMFAFASIVAVYAFGFPHPPDSKEPWAHVDDLLQVFVLSRGVHQVLSTASTSIRDSNFGPIIQFEEYEVILPDDILAALGKLREANYTFGTSDPTHDTSVYEDTIHKWADMTGAMYSGLSSVALACRWAIRLQPKYVEFLRKRKPLALVILAYYCAMLHRLRQNWCLDEWGPRVSKSIWLLLENQWRPLIHWPMRDIFGQAFEPNLT
ncbi:uncharacterized protein ACLA_065560 [Aspergillus clavatus NRRL 1]|uniref:C6 zinc finger domain protein n=1 Tax=Aspergillus clavatus (strain ATCC 1007 / CBS 513.65 / DSM 816 / NCTC 3887 / NRRL 1 / QM 1276 / 107) TaxID=344612 RepID=A1CG42_ASPCL|nr:C6 zinc finger domain protein [Aspergillus clavatus NRRL 1]EAW10922.1 C6 zinc finger domain protein [Aspergillus clavatus NRRL 1]